MENSINFFFFLKPSLIDLIFVILFQAIIANYDNLAKTGMAKPIIAMNLFHFGIQCRRMKLNLKASSEFAVLSLYGTE